MAPSLEQARSDVQSAFEAVRQWVDIDEPCALFSVYTRRSKIQHRPALSLRRLERDLRAR
jgi:hypothetical protein